MGNINCEWLAGLIKGRQRGLRYTRILLGRDVIPSQPWLGRTENRLDVHTTSGFHNREARKPKIYKDVIGQEQDSTSAVA